MTFYVSAYGEETPKGELKYSFIGYSRNKLAAYKYNESDNTSLPFYYETYAVFEYEDIGEEDFIDILKTEWGYTPLELYADEDYIEIFETPFGDYISLTNREYMDLVVINDINHEQAVHHMNTAYVYIREMSKYVRNTSMNDFIAFVFRRYCGILKGYNKFPDKINEYLSRTASFISLLDKYRE